MKKQNEKWNFDNSYAKLPKFFFTKQTPISVSEPKLTIFNNELASYLGVPFELDVLAGNVISKGAEPLAQAYAGHQFGYFTLLGDGRAILLGEQISISSERFDIQLKGSGRTPYSRGGDGRAALGPMLREYIISEAMYALGIPSTRSLAVVTTGETVIREKKLQGAILTRVAKSHIRVGTFEYAFHFGTAEDVRSLADYTINRHFSDIANDKNKYLLMLREVIKRQAFLISKWQLVGFIHGVMNTDNMAVSGETIDYGPCAFMDVYHPATVFSSIDTHGRYSYENQPIMAAWNLARFAETLIPLLHDDEKQAVKLAQKEIADFNDLFQNQWYRGMRAKLGLFNEETEDIPLIKNLLQIMQQEKADFTNMFRSLTLNKKEDMDIWLKPNFQLWYQLWQARLNRQGKSQTEITAHMKKHNPAVIPKNYKVEEALTAAENGELNTLNNLLHVLKNPYEYTPKQEEYSKINTSKRCCGYQTFCGT